MERKKRYNDNEIKQLFKWFGYSKTSKLTNVSIYKLRQMNLETDRTKDKLKLRKHRIINSDLKETHVADFGELSFKSIFDANKHSKSIRTENNKTLRIGILKNLETKKVIWILTEKKENSETLEFLILTAKQTETIDVLKIDNQMFLEAVRRNNIKPKIIPKSANKPYNSYAEQEISRIQKVLHRNYNKIKELAKMCGIHTVINAVCYSVYDNNPNFLLKLTKQQATQKTNIKNVGKIRLEH